MSVIKDAKKLEKRLAKIEKLMKGGYDDVPVSNDKVEARAIDEVSSNSIAKQDQAYQDMLEVADELKRKIAMVQDMNTMGNVKLGLGEAWYQGQGHDAEKVVIIDDDDHILCKHCGGKLKVKSIKKKLHKRKVRRNKAKGKPAPHPPKHMRTKAQNKKKPGPKAGKAKSAKQTEWMKLCKAVSKSKGMAGKPWSEVLKKSSILKSKGVTAEQVKANNKAH